MAGLFKNAVNPMGLAVMALGIAIVFLAGRLVRRVAEGKRETAMLAVKLAGLGVCMLGFLLALLAN